MTVSLSPSVTGAPQVRLGEYARYAEAEGVLNRLAEDQFPSRR